MTNQIINALLNDICNWDLVVRQPGKFEGTAVWAEHFWNAVLEGSGDDEREIDGTLYTVLQVNPEEVERWPVLKEIHAVVMSEDDQGFVHCGYISKGYNECALCGELVIDEPCENEEW
jgi:hypothetical protein